MQVQPGVVPDQDAGTVPVVTRGAYRKTPRLRIHTNCNPTARPHRFSR
jgi:hypothetical protein